jgi:hypothetical protein
MGAKFTIVLDTDDREGLRDALEIATILNRNHRTGYESGITKAKIGKIPLIKLVREVARMVEDGKLDASLRDCKRFVDGRWEVLVHNS